MASEQHRDLGAEFRGLLGGYSLDALSARRLELLWERLSADEHAPTAISGRADVLDRHIADSLAGLEVAAVRGAGAIADIGAGAGVPGLVLAAALPDARVAEVESQRRKAEYIAALAESVGLENARVVTARAEEWEEGLGVHDAVTARALAAQPVVLEYAAPLLREGGVVVEWRGRRDAAEEAAGDAAAAGLGLLRREVRAVSPFPGATDRHLHVFEKVGPTPPGFPRRAGVAVRRPLGRERGAM